MHDTRIKSLFRLNHKNFFVAYLFQAIFTSLVFAVAFVVDDLMDIAIDENYHGENKKYIKMAANAGFLFVFVFVIIYVFHFVFGWGKTFQG